MTVALSFLLDPVVTYGFMRDGLVAAIVVGLVCAVLSCLLVVRHQALLGDAISHAVLLGVALGFLLVGLPGILPGALVVAILTGASITYLERNTLLRRDAAMGICFTTTFALGLALISIVQPRGIDLFHVLFGNIIGLRRSDLLLIVATGTLVLATVVILFRWLHVWSFQPELAQVLGVPLRFVDYTFTALLSASIVVSMHAVGLLLVVAMLILPGATALLLTSRLRSMMLIASGVGITSAITGLYGSFYVNVASGPAIVLASAGCFAVVLLLAPRHGLLAQRLGRRARVVRTLEEDLPAWLTQNDVHEASDTSQRLATAHGLPVRTVRKAARRLQRDGQLSIDGKAISLRGARRATTIAEPGRPPDSHLGSSAPEVDGDHREERAPRVLADCSIGRRTSVQRIDDELEGDDEVEHLARLGLHPGSRICVVASAADYQLIEVDDVATIAVPRNLARRVLVAPRQPVAEVEGRR